MADTIPILKCTHDLYRQLVQQRLGRSGEQATIAYQEFFRRGAIVGDHPAFANAARLLSDIQACTDSSLPELLQRHEEGSTGKFLLKTHDKLEIESVLIPMQSGSTLCVSSQVGCRMGCTFCETGRMGLLRSLSCEEIVAQYFIARHHLRQTPRNVVFMGMGEPFDNYENVINAARVLMDPFGCGLGRKNVTISTSGRIEGIYKLIEEGSWGPNLAVSLNATNDECRDKIMPINRKHPLCELHTAIADYCKATGRQVLLAYVLMQGVNDAPQNAAELAAFTQGLDVKINLIPYNHQSCSRYSPSAATTIQLFYSLLKEAGCAVLLRHTKGSKIMAACGQLGNVRLRRALRSTHS